MTEITQADFEKVDMRAGTIVRIEAFPEAKPAAYKLWIDLGELGVKTSSARVTDFYGMEELLGKQILAVVNLVPKQIAGFISEVLTTGFYRPDQSVVLAGPFGTAPNGGRLA